MPSSYQSEQPNLARIGISSGGMMCVALVCAAAGFIFDLDRSVQPSTDYEYAICIGLYGLLILPYFYSRYASVEVRWNSHRDLLNNGLIFPAFLFGAVLIISVLAAAIWIRPERWTSDSLILIAAVLPFIDLFIAMQRNVRDDEVKSEERNFKNKVLLPAFATCLVSFSYGWSLGNQESALKCMIVPFLLVFVGRHLIAPNRWFWALPFVAIVLVAAAVAKFWFAIDVGQVVFVGTVLTMAMGVAEVCKRVVWINSGHRVLGTVATTEDPDFYLAGSNWSSIVFPLMLSWLPIFVEPLAVLPIFLVLSAQYSHWHHFSGDKTSPLLTIGNVFLGFAIPMTIVLQHFLSFPSLTLRDGLVEACVAVDALYVTGVHIYFRKNLELFGDRIFEKQTYLEAGSNFSLFLTISMVLILAMFLVWNAADPSSYLVAKSGETIVCLTGLIFFDTIVRFSGFALVSWRMTDNRRAPEMRFDGRSNFITPKCAGALPMLILKVARAPVGLIAGVPVAVLLYTHTAIEPFAILLCSIPIVAATMVGFVLNDVYDRSKDRFLGNEKPLAAGLIDSEAAVLFAIGLALVALGCAAITSRNGSFPVIVATLGGVSAYSWIARYVPSAKGIVTAILSCAPILYASRLADIDIPIIYFAMLIAFIFGRELLLDLRDACWDRMAGINTLAVRLRSEIVELLGWGLMLASSALAVVVAPRNAMGAFLIAFISVAFCMFLYRSNRNKALGLSRVTLLIAAIAVGIAA